MEENKEVTNDELAIMIGKGFKSVDEKFEKMEEDINGLKADVSELKTDVSELKTDVSELKTDVSELKTDIQNVKNQMVSKSFMTDKLIDLKGELVLPLKMEDKKINIVTDKLGDKKVFNSNDVNEIKSIEVFSKVV